MKEVVLFLFLARKGLFFMKDYDLTRKVIAIVGIVLLLTYILFKELRGKKPLTTKFITRTAIFAAISILLYMVPGLKFPLPFFPSFLELHFDEVPLLIAGFAYGPWSGFFALLIKTLVKLPVSNTMMVGELADFIYSFFFIIPAAIVYKKQRNFKGVIIGLGIGTISQLIASSFITTFLILDFYMFMMHFPKAAIMGAITKVGINISSLDWPFLFAVALPFNAFKDNYIEVGELSLDNDENDYRASGELWI